MVNTFVISSNIRECARALDYRRLGKQRVEARQIFNGTTANGGDGWKNHPATLAWVGHANALHAYTNAMIDEWISRGYNNNMEKYEISTPVVWPWWFEWEVLHNSHKASLNRKDPSYYSFAIPPGYSEFGYVWPSKTPLHLRNKANPPLSEVCAPITPIVKKKKIGTKRKADETAVVPTITQKSSKQKAVTSSTTDSFVLGSNNVEYRRSVRLKMQSERKTNN